MEEEAIAFNDNDCSPAFDEDSGERGSSANIGTVSISYALTPVATSIREVLSISAAVNLSNILEGNSWDEVYRRAKLYTSEIAQTGGRFMISKLGISFVRGNLNRNIYSE